MSRRSSRARRRSNLAFTIMAVVVIGLLLFGAVAAVISDRGGGGGDQASDDAAARITPGSEINKLETQIAQNPDDVDSIVVLANVLANSGRTQESIQWFERAVEQRPDDEQLRLAFGRALSRNGSAFDAELQFKKAVELAPQDPVAPYYLGQLYEQLSPPSLDQAAHWYQQAIDLDPTSVIADQARNRLAALNASGSPISASPDATP